MPAPKQALRKPEYWQQFEDLCKRLWGEIWQCPEIKKNGRAGQVQHGIDVYGIPRGESAYYGIQCKGKDDYSNAVLTKEEIDSEISRAAEFKPPLKKLYFATTANKDTVLEEHVRSKDLESRALGRFEVHLFSWEDIVDLIDANHLTHEWYVRNIDHRTTHDATVTFRSGEEQLSFRPLLLRNHVTYKYREPTFSISSLRYDKPPDYLRNTRIEIDTSPQPVMYFIDGVSRRKGSCLFSLRITNTGSAVIEHFKLDFKLQSSGVRCGTVDKARSFTDRLIDPAVNG